MDHEHPHRIPNRTRLSGLAGRKYWRSLEEFAQTKEFEQFVEREFPQQASTWHDPISRRNFVKLMAASIALAGLTGCYRAGDEQIVPYVTAPEQVIPGRPLFFATTMPLFGYGVGVIAESHMGRPIKIDGNPRHPASLGGSNPFMQASVLTLWDPDRARTVTYTGEVSTWTRFLDQWGRLLPQLRQTGGLGLRILTGTITSPTLISQMQRLGNLFPEARWHHYDPVSHDSARQGARLAFGQLVSSIYHFDRAQRVLSLDSNFLYDQPGSVRYARAFIDQRRIRAPRDFQGQPTGMDRLVMNRLYMLQSTPNITGAVADHRLVMPATQVEDVARFIAAQLGVPGVGASSPISERQQQWIAAMVRDLKQHGDASLVVPGEFQTPLVHALAHAMNDTLNNVGKTVSYIQPVEANPDDQTESLQQLVEDMRAGRVEILVILGVNPVFTAPADLNFVDALERVGLRIHHSLYYNETSFHCHWHIPETHYLESWSDIRAYDGTASIIQPLIAPLYRSRTQHQVVAALMGDPEPAGATVLQDYWRPRVQGNFEAFWLEVLRWGIIPNTAYPTVQVPLQPDFLQKHPEPRAIQPAPDTYEVVFRPDPSIWDGEFANNGWLQELPKPLTKVTWDNPALISPTTARRLGIEREQILLLRHNDDQLRIPAWIVAGHPDNTISIYLGGGRERAGRVGTAAGGSGGFNAYRLRTAQHPWILRGVRVEPTGDTYTLACTQNHQVLNAPAEELIQARTIDEFIEQIKQPGPPPERTPEERIHETRFNIYPGWDYSTGHQWAMVIDNNACIGCNACVIACQAENNIPIVGKDGVHMGREMHWLRIDTYHSGDPDADINTYFEPLPCMHCETAPCEVVCPVVATSHSAEGLNEMTYNRCVGTRYCSNNCPYKVRRFNFFRYTDETPPKPLGHNPEVTIRARGVMEKCTYCVQRLNATRTDIEILRLKYDAAETQQEKNRIRQQMDELMRALTTACAAACPTEAIIFGDLNWRFLNEQGNPYRSDVYQLKKQPQNFGLLVELNTQPRTTYLPKFYNLNDEIGPPPTAEIRTGQRHG